MSTLLPERSRVLWFGASPSSAECAEFANRALDLVQVTDESNPDFTYARGAVFCAHPPAVPIVASQLGAVRDALDHGLLVFLLASDDAVQIHVWGELPAIVRDGQKAADFIRRRTGTMRPHECAEAIARHDPGKPANWSLDIALVGSAILRTNHRFLIQRAFSDCGAVSLTSLDGGRSTSTYLVQATLKASEAGPRPLPFFAKLDSSTKILAERSCYELYAETHIPWYLRPNLQPKRCIIGVDQGILVGSFVEQSESLWDAVLKGKGSRYIHALFEETLLGWRSQAYRASETTGSIASELSDVFRYELARPEHVERAQQFGSVKSPKDLRANLLNLPRQKWRQAPMHGDMHAENVRVRSNDAIIIDLANAKVGPLCADLASMEVWLAFQVPPAPYLPTRHSWTNFISQLYSPATVNRPPPQDRAGTGLDWLSSSIRQVRMISRCVCESETEYSAVIAMYLLRRACYPPADDEDAFRRVFAYWLGSNLVQSLSNA